GVDARVVLLVRERERLLTRLRGLVLARVGVRTVQAVRDREPVLVLRVAARGLSRGGRGGVADRSGGRGGCGRRNDGGERQGCGRGSDGSECAEEGEMNR